MHSLKTIFLFIISILVGSFSFTGFSQARTLSLLFYNLENFSMNTEMPSQAVIDKYLSYEDIAKIRT